MWQKLIKTDTEGRNLCFDSLMVFLWISISPLTNKRVQPSAVCHYLLNCNYTPTPEDFSVLCHENKKYLSELKESLLIMRDRQSMNRKIRSAPPYLFEWDFVTFCCTLWTSVISFLVILGKFLDLRKNCTPFFLINNQKFKQSPWKSLIC